MSEDYPSLVDTGEGYTITYKNKKLYPDTSPERAAIRRLPGSAIPPKTLILLPSPILFYGYPNLKNLIDESCHILAIESDETLMKTSVENTASEIIQDPQLTYVRAENASVVHTILDELGVWRFRRVLSLKLSGGYRLATGFYREAEHAADSAIRAYWQNRMTKIHMEPLWIKNLFSNLPYLSTSGDVDTVHTTKPVVVAGAGESLEHAVPVIKELRNQLIVLAVDTALPVIFGLGVVPDFVVALEAQHANLNDFLGMPTSMQLVYDVSSYPAIVRSFPTRFAVATAFDTTALLDRLSDAGLLPYSVPPLGSVGVTALYLALHITAGPVLIAGLDFSYVPGKTHARGAPAHAKLLNSVSRTSPTSITGISDVQISASGKDGRRYVSDIVLNGYGMKMAELAEQSGRVYDIGNEGLYFGGIRLSNLAQIKATVEGYHESAERDKPASLPFKREDLLEFITHEQSLLVEAARAAEAYQNGTSSYDAVEEPIRNVDYVYAHFPEDPPFPKPDPSFMRRFILSARGYAALAARSAKELQANHHQL